MSRFNPVLESVARIRIHEFESEMEPVWADLEKSMGRDALESMCREFEPEVISWRAFCAPNTPDIDHAFLVCLEDSLDLYGV